MIEKARDDLLHHMMSMSKDEMSVGDLKIYAETLRIASEVQLKNYTEMMAEMIRHNSYAAGFCATTKEGELS